MTTYELNIGGMSCGHCVKTVRQALESVQGVTKVEVQIGHAHVETREDVPRARLVEALEQVDYPVT